MSPLFFALMLTTLGTSAETAEEPVVAVPGQRIEAQLEAGFLALCGAQVHSATVKRQPDGTLQTVAPCRPQLLLRGIRFVTPGPVVRARVRSAGIARGSPSGPLRVELSLPGDRGRIERIRLGSTGYRLVYSPRVGEPVTLYECQSTDAAQWSLLWAGDLDRDGKLDFADGRVRRVRST